MIAPPAKTAARALAANVIAHRHGLAKNARLKKCPQA